MEQLTEYAGWLCIGLVVIQIIGLWVMWIVYKIRSRKN